MTFASVIGHAPIVDLLRHAAARGRVPQSLIFAGPDGVGKRVVALALAQAVNCPHRRDGDACGTCATCLRIARGQYPDVTTIDKGSEASIKIRVVRERLLDAVAYRPFEGARKVYIIDQAEEMTLEAQDALLKTLEEPPSAAILILITAFPDTLLATIRSRCRRLRFGWLTEEDVVRVLVEREGLEPAAARGLAAASGGSVARALAEQSGSFDDDRRAALALLAAAQGGAIPPRLKAAGALAQHGSKRRDRDATQERLGIVLSLLRDLAALAADDGRVPLANEDVAGDLRDLAPAFSLPRVSAAYSSVEQASRHLDRNASPKIVADWLAVVI
ncbi:MAG: DNA polymerase III subunit delta' [Acidobacteria bacterium]|nr:DNA polymerase III subunit delta' [Acidobacteriota bacterium]